MAKDKEGEKTGSTSMNASGTVFAGSVISVKVANFEL